MLYFKSFEIREKEFNDSVSHLIPCKYKGPHRFWQEFNQIVKYRLNQANLNSTVHITSNPRDCLAFGTCRQVLTAAQMLAKSKNRYAIESIQDIAEQFDLTQNLDQPLRTLSGGETVKLALAKAYLLKTMGRRLSIASPFCWLSSANLPLLTNVVKAYQQHGLSVTIYALEGEDDLDQKPFAVADKWFENGPYFEFQTRNAQLRLGSAVFEIGGSPLIASILDSHVQLRSPCLIQGGNGQGKSLLARALSKAVRTHGTIAILNYSGEVRLLFQDVIKQTLLRSFKGLAKSSGRVYDQKVEQLFHRIRNYYQAVATDGDLEILLPDYEQKVASLLSIKIMLAAIRLCHRPKALILDEPDWGLTRRSAESLVLAIVRCAHDLKVPVMIISHKPWWKKMIRSSLTIRKIPQPMTAQNNCPFVISVQPI